MIWSICYAIFLVAVCVSLFIFFRQYRWKRKRYSTAVKSLIVGFAIGLFALFLPIQIDTFGTDAAGIVKAVLFSLNRTLRGFVLTDINFMTQNASISSEMYPVYSVTVMLLCFICPLLTLSYILTFFSKVCAGVKFIFSFSKELCVFSQMNENSVALAKDMAKDHPKRRVVFCGVNDAFKNQNSHLVNDAEKIKAVYFERDICSLSFRFHKKKCSIWFFTIGDNEQQNTNEAVELAAKFRDRENTRIYLFSSLPESHMILSGIDPGSVIIRRIDMTRLLIYRFLYNSGEILFGNAADLGGPVKTISAVIVGLGGYGKELLKALAWYCQMDGYRIVIDAYDIDTGVAERLEAECSDLLDPKYNGVEAEGEAEYQIKIHAGIDARSSSFYRSIQTLAHPTFAFVALGSDSDNIEISSMLRTYFERAGVKPDIYTVIKSGDKKRMINNIENFKHQKYGIHSIGDIPSTFSEKEIIGSDLEQEALRHHKIWGDEADFWRYEYNYQSSLARAIHRKARGGLQQKADEAEVTEHKRWNAYMRSLGYTYSGSPDPSSRNDLAKTHNDLISYNQLSLEEKLKDKDT